MRTDSWSFALLASLSLLAACGDGIDEGAGRPATGDTADTVNSHDTVTPTTVAPSPPAPLTIQLSETDVEHSNATYSGAHSVAQLDNGTYLLSGFDNHSDADHPERGALWRSTDLQRWERIGAEISDADNQQTIARVLSIDDLGIVLGTDYSRSSDPQDFSRFDATVWLTDDEGGSFTAVRIARDARVLSGSIIGDEIVVWGSRDDGNDGVQAAIWRSSDQGRHWTEQLPAAAPGPGRAAQPIRQLTNVLRFEDHLLAVGANVLSDPSADGSLPDPLTDALTSPSAFDAVDVGIWYSDDDGATWLDAAAGGLTGQFDAQWPLDAVVAGDHLIVLASTASVDDNDFDGRLHATAYTCDAALSACTPSELQATTFDHVAGTLTVRDDGLVAIFGNMFNDDSDSQTSAVMLLDPATGLSATTTQVGDLEQVEAMRMIGGTLYLFGRSRDTNLVQVATADSVVVEPSTPTTTTVAGTPPTLEADVLGLTSPKPAGNFSGLHTVVQLPDDSWLAAGFDNDQDPETPEAAVLWRSTDLLHWARVSGAITAESGVQAITVLHAPAAGPLLAVGGTYDGIDLADGLSATAMAWTSSDGGSTWQGHEVAAGAAVDGVLEDDAGLLAWGHAVGARAVVPSRLWRSADGGLTWADVEAAGKGVDGSIGFVQTIVQWGEDLLAVSHVDTTDPTPTAQQLETPVIGDPVQVHLLRSTDGGESWSKVANTGLAAPSVTQVAVGALVEDGHLLIAGADDAGTRSFEPVLWDCDPRLQCSRHQLATSIGQMEVVTGDIAMLHGVAVVLTTASPQFLIAERSDFMLPWETAGRSYLCAYDLSNGGSAVRTLTRINQVEDLVADGDRLLAVGRYEHPDGRLGDLEIAAITAAAG